MVKLPFNTFVTTGVAVVFFLFPLIFLSFYVPYYFLDVSLFLC